MRRWHPRRVTGLVALAMGGISVMLLVGCANGDEQPPEPSIAPFEPSGGSPVAAATPGPLTLTDDELGSILGRLAEARTSERRGSVLAEITASGDPRFVAPLIHIWVFSTPAGREEVAAVLETLAGERPAGTTAEQFFSWFDWLVRHDQWPLPERYIEWKADLLAARRSPEAARFLQSEPPVHIRPELVLWGGVPPDGIPPLDDPSFVPASQVDYLLQHEPVLGAVIDGDARAYPLRILDWHEMVNHRIGDRQVALAYCTLCGAGVLYATEVDGGVLTFSTSGLLYQSNKLMYDRQTETLWNHMTGSPVMGPLAGSGIVLERLPLVRATWEDWLARHPETLVLNIETGYSREYLPGAAYGDYPGSSELLFPIAQRSDLLPLKAEVFALLVEGEPRAYPLDVLAEARVVNDRVGDVPVVLISGRDSGTRAYLRGDREFRPRSPVNGDGSISLADQDGTTWIAGEEALTVEDGDVHLERLGGHVTFWFGWFSFYPHTTVYGSER